MIVPAVAWAGGLCTALAIRAIAGLLPDELDLQRSVRLPLCRERRWPVALGRIQIADVTIQQLGVT